MFFIDQLSVKSSHVPNLRSLEEIFEEDTVSAEKYLQIREDDDEIKLTNLDVKSVIEKWSEADFHQCVLDNIIRAKYIVPRKIQSYVIPLILDGFDVKGHAETGSGKTAAFLLPIINMIISKKNDGVFKSKRSRPFALIIEPTRELTLQLYDQARKFCYGTLIDFICNILFVLETKVTVAKAYGSYRSYDNLKEISDGCDILIGTPGRLLYFFENKSVIFNYFNFINLNFFKDFM